jgi:ADP-heptose:LPS heptosyltransferase
VVVGAPNEREVGQQVAAAAQHPITVLSGQFPLRTLIALIGHFRLFLTNDCGAMHLAAARNVPLVLCSAPPETKTPRPITPTRASCAAQRWIVPTTPVCNATANANTSA